MEFLFEFLAEIVVEVLSAVLDFFIIKDKKPASKKSDVVTRSILKRQAIKRTHRKKDTQ